MTPGALFNVASSLIIASTPPIIVDNATTQGLRVDWSIDKTRTSTPDQGVIEIYNLNLAHRKVLSESQKLPQPMSLSLFIGWGGIPEQVFAGQAWKVTPEEHRDVDVITKLEVGDGAQPLRDTPPAGGSVSRQLASLAFGKLIGDLKVIPSAGTTEAVLAASAKLPVSSFQLVQDEDPRTMMDLLMASLGLSWGIEYGFFVVYQNGLRNDVLPTILTPRTGLLGWREIDDGGVEFEALAQPRVVPGAQISVHDVNGIVQGSASLRVEQVSFRGSSMGPSTMSGVARPVTVITG